MSITTPSSVPLNLLKKMLIGRRDALKNLGDWILGGKECEADEQYITPVS